MGWINDSTAIWAPIRRQVWDVLAECCDAGPQPTDFDVWPRCTEYRFMGALGFGGKVYAQGGRIWVSTYRESRTPERDAMIAAANERLAVIARSSVGGSEVTP